MAKVLEGGCSCGAVRYRLTARPMFVHCCHCTDCQRHTGSAFVINALIEAAHVELLAGRPRKIAMPTESGRPHEIFRCPRCLVAVWSDYGRRRNLLFIRVGTLDRPKAVAPDVHIYTRSKQPWVRLPEGARVFRASYDSKLEWPARSLARRAALSTQGKPRAGATRGHDGAAPHDASKTSSS